MEFVIVLVVLLVAVFVITGPLRAAWAPGDDAGPGSGSGSRSGSGSTTLAELEAAREAKYREIREAELDHQTGKLSDEDYAAIDRALRAEAIEILHAIDRLATIGHR
jgi:hypothetical protein